MAFTQALYYPWIDIRSDGWLKTASLYWDELRTIVPQSIDAPYSSRVAREFQDAGFLLPLRVTPEMGEIESLAEDVLKYLDSPEATEAVLGEHRDRGARIHVDKLPRSFTELAMIHEEKLPLAIRELVSQAGQGRVDRGWIAVDPAFADFYMTLLASRLGDRIGASLLTPLPSSDRLALTARVDAQLSGLLTTSGRRHPREYDAIRPRRTRPRSLATGMLAHLTLEQVSIDPDADVRSLVAFRQSHSDELARFRSEVEGLTKQIEADLPWEALRQRVQDLYLNNVQPAVSDLQAALKGSRIRSVGEGFIKVALLSTGPSAMLVSAGLSIPLALLAGAGASLAVSGILYNLDRKDALRKSPYSYVLTAGRDLQ